ncbi:sel1 repeat family protein [Herbaspirillum sp. AP02]|uniref:tetratricopeptide repeat protein n=1 Tax=unclassified Herbaspirillum TaxID=2624150 RepID=UPI0015DAA141|nr:MULTISPECIES: SEL1-like repeat protein [unclassified Herbaspirillum]MBG7620453.1 sel1 repeat family protein [Herbaspirillum sp. AP02]NZD67917.1 sel1 repeat family protein [Herbaspirillum sp. AP21]
MATREELAVIKAARAGESCAQLALGRRYLNGGSGLPRSKGTAFYWLRRAAQQGVDDAWMIIGRNITYEQVKDLSSPQEAAVWYEKAFEAGVPQAGLIFARLVLEHTDQFDSNAHARAIAALSLLASRDDHQAQWLLAQQMQRHGQPVVPGAASSAVEERLMQEAARAGIEQAQYALLDKAWQQGEGEAFARGARPLVERLLERNSAAVGQLDKEADAAGLVRLIPEEATLLLRYGQWQARTVQPELEELMRLFELAAVAGENEARLELGLLCAKIDRQGQRVFMEHGLANFKKALHWLELAGEGGSAPAWHALARIYSRSIYSQRNLQVAQQYLEKAAEAGLTEAQAELAHIFWRNRRDDPMHDVKALYWWQQAAARGDAESAAALLPFQAQEDAQDWAVQARAQLSDRLRNSSPFLSARIELAAIFGLTKPEALLIDVKQADYGHCLVVDICAHHARSKRRLIAVQNEAQRAAINRVSRLFGDVDCGFSGPEGNYRQRQYRLRTAFPEVA